MIDLTPIDVRKKKGDFPRSLRGYDPADVDLFLDLAADRLEEVVNEALRLEERVRYLDGQLRHYREREQALTEALVSAQELREDARRQAAKEAELIRREAETEAERIRSAAARALEQEEDVLRRLRARRAQLLQTFRSFLERELRELEVMERTGGTLPEVQPPGAADRTGASRRSAGGAAAKKEPPMVVERFPAEGEEGG